MNRLIAKRTASSTNGLELAYWVRRASNANANGKFLLLLHGGASNHTRWSEFVEHSRLTEDWNIVCPDMRGNAESMTRARLGMSVWCADLLDILAAEGAAAAVIAGHSLGAQIAVHFTHRHPDKSDGLILIDPIFQSALQGKSRLVRRYRWLLQALIGVIRGLNFVGLRRRNIQDRDLRELDAETRLAIAGAESFEAIAKRYGALGPILKHMPTANYLRQVLAGVSPLPPLSEVRVPVLILLSGGTTLANLDLNRDAAAGFANHEIVTLKANHWPLTETPDAVRETIDDWVAQTFPANRAQSGSNRSNHDSP